MQNFPHCEWGCIHNTVEYCEMLLTSFPVFLPAWFFHKKTDKRWWGTRGLSLTSNVALSWYVTVSKLTPSLPLGAEHLPIIPAPPLWEKWVLATVLDYRKQKCLLSVSTLWIKQALSWVLVRTHVQFSQKSNERSRAGFPGRCNEWP